MAKKARLFVGRGRYSGYTGDYRSTRSMGTQLNRSLNSIMDQFNDFVEHVEGVSTDILVDALEETLGKAIEYCPVEGGDLRASAYLEAERTSRGNHQAVMGFGRNGFPAYAVHVHELPNYHEPPTRSKFLQSAIEEDYDVIQKRVLAGYSQIVGGS